AAVKETFTKKPKSPILAAKAAAKGDASGAPPANWTDGVPEFETYLAMVKEKLEVLTRAKNFAFIRHFVAMIDDDDTTLLAASALLALPHDAARLLIADISPEHVAKIRAL